jgi:nitroreductase
MRQGAEHEPRRRRLVHLIERRARRTTGRRRPAITLPATVPTAQPDEPVPLGPDAPIMDVLRTMRAMRRLKPDPVPKDLLERLVAAATWAPNGGNLQLYDFIVVTDRAQVARLGALWRDVENKYMAMLERVAPDIFTDPDAQAVRDSVRYQAEHFDDTPAVIAACCSQPPRTADPRVLVEVLRTVGPRFLTRVANPRLAAVQGAASSYPGVQNLLLAARALGLAANLSTWHLWAQDDFKRVLGVPKQTTIYALVPLGWPAGRFGPVRRRPVADVVHGDRW